MPLGSSTSNIWPNWDKSTAAFLETHLGLLASRNEDRPLASYWVRQIVFWFFLHITLRLVYIQAVAIP